MPRRSPRPSPAGRAGPLAGVARVLIDGRNVQRALERGSAGGAGAGAPPAGGLPTTALIARLRAAFLGGPEVELILDGHAGGSPSGRVAPGFSVAFSRGRTADELIAELVSEAYATLGAGGAWAVLVVTDDRAVRDHARRHGARVEGAAWLADRLARGGSVPLASGASARPRPGTTLGNVRPPRVAGAAARRCGRRGGAGC